MHQFIQGPDEAFEVLAQQAQNSCVSFADQALPSGAQPETARVGFQINADESAAILVDRGAICPRASEKTRRWLREGELRFSSFEELREWIRGELSTDYALASANAESPFTARSLPPETLTDLAAVQNQLAQITSPPFDMAQADSQIREALQTQVRGQDAATSTLAFRVARHLARAKPRRPLSAFAVGPTGVGKTRSAEVLAEALGELGQRSHLRRSERYGFLRLDMNEYQEKHRISQLLGSPQGYLGYGDGAQLVDALSANPRTVVLLDEIEKAHPDILRALMNALDAGRLSRAGGGQGNREIDCRLAIFFFTSNLNNGIEEDLRVWEAIENPSEFGDYSRPVEEICRRRLHQSGIAPELIGRMSCFLAFRPLKPSARAEIVTLAIVHVAREYDVEIVQIAPEVVAHVLQNGPESDFGARPDEYFVDELFGDAFATAKNAGSQGQFELTGPPFVCSPVGVEAKGD